MNADSVELFQTALYLIVSLSVVGTAYMVLSPLLEGDKLKKRMDSVAEAREGMRQSRLDQLNKEAGLRLLNMGTNLMD